MAPSVPKLPPQQSSDDDFLLVTNANAASHQHAMFPTFEATHDAPVADTDVPFTAALRKRYPHLNVTTVQTSNVDLVQYAALGYAEAELDRQHDAPLRWRGYVGPAHRGQPGQLGDATFFARYNYRWRGEDFIIFVSGSVYQQLQYVLHAPDAEAGEDALSHCAKTDALIMAAVEVLGGDENKFVYVFDGYWMRSSELWDEVQQASWEKVILDAGTKTALQDVSQSFFDSEAVYKRYGVPWKRGLIFYGPPGNGKTISIKALMKTMYNRRKPVPSLYVKSAPLTVHLRMVFAQARAMTPCMLIFEDIETIVTPATRSYFFNEVDGLASNDGLLMIASTNYMDRLDPGLSKRPSRFDRKYLFPLPDEHERAMYCAYWREKLRRANNEIPFPEKLDLAIARITADFSFAYLQEAFVATMLVLARDSTGSIDGGVDEAGLVEKMDHTRIVADDDGDDGDDDGGDGDGDDDAELRGYKLWRVMKKQVAMLRKDLTPRARRASPLYRQPPPVASAAESEAAAASLPPLPQGQVRSIFNTPPRVPTGMSHGWLRSNGYARDWYRVDDGRVLGEPVTFDDCPPPADQSFAGSSAGSSAGRVANDSDEQRRRHRISIQEMANQGIGKKKYITERAYEYSP